MVLSNEGEKRPTVAQQEPSCPLSFLSSHGPVNKGIEFVAAPFWQGAQATTGIYDGRENPSS